MIGCSSDAPLAFLKTGYVTTKDIGILIYNHLIMTLVYDYFFFCCILLFLFISFHFVSGKSCTCMYILTLFLRNALYFHFHIWYWTYIHYIVYNVVYDFVFTQLSSRVQVPSRYFLIIGIGIQQYRMRVAILNLSMKHNRQYKYVSLCCVLFSVHFNS